MVGVEPKVLLEGRMKRNGWAFFLKVSGNFLYCECGWVRLDLLSMLLSVLLPLQRGGQGEGCQFIF